MSTATKSQPKVQFKQIHDPITGSDNYLFRYKGRQYAFQPVPVKGDMSYKLWEEYVEDNGHLVGAGEFYTSHNRFKNEQAALKDAAATIQEMEDFAWWPDDIDPDYEAMVDSFRGEAANQ